MHETRSRVASLLISFIRAEMTETDTSFLSYLVFLGFRTVPYKMPLLVTIVTDGLICVFSISAVACRAGGVSCIDTGSWGTRVLPSFRLVVIPFLLPSSFLVRGFA